MNTNVERMYDTYYKNIDFERAGLFEFLSSRYNVKTVLYPGCSIHVTPSFYFRHVVYVDRSDIAKDFFSHADDVERLIGKRKVYAQRSFFKFYGMDCRVSSVMPEAGFDLLLGIFAGSLVLDFVKYLNPGGIVVMNEFNDEMRDVFGNPSLRLSEVITCRNGSYAVEKPGTVRKRKTVKNMVRTNRGFSFRDNDEYFVFEKAQGRVAGGRGKETGI